MGTARFFRQVAIAYLPMHWLASIASALFVTTSSRHSSVTSLNMVQTEQRLQDLGLELPPPPKAAANYLPCQRSGNMLYLSGHLPMMNDGSLMTGKLGGNGRDLDHGISAARQAGLNILATLKDQVGDLDNVEQIVKLLGIVQSADDFHEQHKVMNGCSDLLCEVLGPDRGVHARSAIGTNALPLDSSVEVEAIVRIRQD